MVIRTRKEAPLYEKFGLFTEAPKKKKKRVINIRSPRTRDYTALAMDDIELNNISPEEEPLSGEIGELDFTDNGEQDTTAAQDRNLEGELDNELDSLQRLRSTQSDDSVGSGNGASNDGGEIDNGNPEGTDVQPETELDPQYQGSEDTSSTPVGDDTGSTADGAVPGNPGDNSGTESDGDRSDAGTEPGDAEDNGTNTNGISGEYPDNQGVPEEPSPAGDDNPSGDAGGDQQLQAPTEPAGNDGDNGDGGSADIAGENPTDSDGTGDVDETIEIEIPSEDDDYLVDEELMDTDSDMDSTEDPNADPTTMDPEADPSATDPAVTDPSTDPNAEMDPNAGTDPNATETIDVPDPSADPNAQSTDPTADPTATDPNADPAAGVNADLEAFDKNDMRKFQLFKRFIDLHDVSLHFVSVLDAIISDDAEYGSVIATITKKLKRVEEILKDYMILKFQSDSYLQNSFFFEKAKTTILLALEILKQGKKPVNTSKH